MFLQHVFFCLSTLCSVKIKAAVIYYTSLVQPSVHVCSEKSKSHCDFSCFPIRLQCPECAIMAFVADSRRLSSWSSEKNKRKFDGTSSKNFYPRNDCTSIDSAFSSRWARIYLMRCVNRQTLPLYLHHHRCDLYASLSVASYGTSSHLAPARAMSCFTVWIQSFRGRPGSLLQPAGVHLNWVQIGLASHSPYVTGPSQF